MAVFETWLKSDLQMPVIVSKLTGNLFSADNGGNRIGVEVMNDGEPAELEGIVSGYFIRNDGATVIITGELDGNRASVVLPASAYAVVGPCSLVIKVGETTVGACSAVVYKSTTDEIVDPGKVIPSLAELLAQIAACREATEDANDAAELANTNAELAAEATTYANESGDLAVEKAGLAETKAGLANDAAELANTKAALADEKADLAQDMADLAENNAGLANDAADLANEMADLAESKATAANSAAASANTAANKINNMTVSANGLAAGQDPTATISEVSGHKHILFGIPKGDKGDPGKDFRIKRTFVSIEAMEEYDPELDPSESKVLENDFVMIDTGSVQDPDTGKLYCYEPETLEIWRYIGDLSGAQGIKGDTGNGISSTVLNPDYTLTINYTDGTSVTTASVRGDTGEKGDTGDPGVSIYSVALNADYTLTIIMTDGTTFTTTSIRGEKGEKGNTGDQGNGISGIVMNQDDTITITLDDGTDYTTVPLRGATGLKGDTGATGPQGETGERGSGIANIIMNQDDTITIVLEDGTSYITAPLRGATGATGPQGETGAPGPMPVVSVGTVTTLDPGTNATVTITGPAAAPVINFGIPRGADTEYPVHKIDFSILPADWAAVTGGYTASVTSQYFGSESYEFVLYDHSIDAGLEGNITGDKNAATHTYTFKVDTQPTGTVSGSIVTIAPGAFVADGKADKVSSATAGNFAGLDANGNLTDSGYSATSLSVIDDTAGAGDTDKAWSADKLTTELAAKAPTANPVFTGSISMVRKANTMVGSNSVAEGVDTTASASQSHAEGNYTTASGQNSHAEGGGTTASGSQSHAEGAGTTASGENSHAEGASTTASGAMSHAEGVSTTASGAMSHAEGNVTTASGNYSHAEGYNTIANHESQHVVGRFNVADPSGTSATSTGTYLEIVGNGTAANNRSNARTLDLSGNERLKGDLYVGCNADSSGGSKVVSSNNPVFTGSISMGRASSSTVGGNSVATGNNVIASGTNSHAEGNGTKATSSQSHAEGDNTTASGQYSHAEGSYTTASGTASHAEGGSTQATQSYSHAEGYGTTASGQYSHAEGCYTTASGQFSHAEGGSTQATESYSHAEGYNTTASGQYSHAEGNYATASGRYSHAEGYNTTASGYYSHAEGYYATAAGYYSHAGGMYNVIDNYDTWPEWVANTSYAVGDRIKRTTGSGSSQTITGYICKTANSDSSFTSSKWYNQYGKTIYAEIIGNGTSTSARSNARTLDWDGNERLKGDLYVGCNADSTGGTKVVKTTDTMTGATSSAAGASGLVPAPSSGDQGKFLKGDGSWSNVDALPAVTSSDNGKFLCVVNGAWAAETVPSAIGVSF